jgi:hypothetical protein
MSPDAIGLPIERWGRGVRALFVCDSRSASWGGFVHRDTVRWDQDSQGHPGLGMLVPGDLADCSFAVGAPAWFLEWGCIISIGARAFGRSGTSTRATELLLRDPSRGDTDATPSFATLRVRLACFLSLALSLVRKLYRPLCKERPEAPAAAIHKRLERHQDKGSAMHYCWQSKADKRRCMR